MEFITLTSTVMLSMAVGIGAGRVVLGTLLGAVSGVKAERDAAGWMKRTDAALQDGLS